MVLVRVVEAYALLEMGVRLGELAEREPAYSQGLVGLQEECRVVETLGQAQTLLPQLPRRLMLGSSQIQQPQAKQHWKEIWGVLGLLAEFASAVVGRGYFRRRESSDGHQGGAERGLQGQFRLDARRRVRQGGEQRDTLPEVGNRFDIGRALDGALPGPLPVAD